MPNQGNRQTKIFVFEVEGLFKVGAYSKINTLYESVLNAFINSIFLDTVNSNKFLLIVDYLKACIFFMKIIKN